MNKITLDEVESGYKVSTINANFQEIQRILNDQVVFRQTTEPNSMAQAFDANNYPVINVRTPRLNKEAANKLYVDAAIERALSGVEGETVDFQLLIERVGDAEAAITEEKLVRVSEDEALASSLTQLNVSVGQVSADIVSELTARATADSAMASSITTLQSRVGTNEAAIASEVSTRTTQYGAMASSISTISADVASNTSAITSEATARTSAYSALASQISTVSANVASNTASITSEATARASADSALSSQITTVSSNLGSLSSSVSTQMSAVNSRLGVAEAKYTLKLDVNGYVSGFESIAGASSSSFTVKADVFKITMPGYGDYVPFAVGPSNVIFNGTTNWPNVTGTGKPQDYATVGADSSNLKVGIGANLLYNAGLNLSNDGWWGHPNSGRNLLNWNIAQGGSRYGTFKLYEDGYTGGGAMYIDGVNKVPVTPGQRYELSVYTGAHRCRVWISVDFWDWQGNSLGAGNNIVLVNGGENNQEASGGIALSDYKRIGAFVTAPANAATSRFVLWKSETKPGLGDSYLLACLPFYGVAGVGQTELSPWSEGSAALNTKITSSNIVTYIDNAAINSAQIADASITSAKIGSAEVGSLNIAGNAVTVPQVTELAVKNVDGGNVTTLTSTQTLATFSTDVNGQGKILLQFNPELTIVGQLDPYAANGTLNYMTVIIRIKRNSTVIREYVQQNNVYLNRTTGTKWVGAITDVVVPGTTVTYTAEVYTQSSISIRHVHSYGETAVVGVEFKK